MKPKRKHGPSRLEKLLEVSIRHELQIKHLRQLVMALAVRLAAVERPK